VNANRGPYVRRGLNQFILLPTPPLLPLLPSPPAPLLLFKSPACIAAEPIIDQMLSTSPDREAVFSGGLARTRSAQVSFCHHAFCTLPLIIRREIKLFFAEYSKLPYATCRHSRFAAAASFLLLKLLLDDPHQMFPKLDHSNAQASAADYVRFVSEMYREPLLFICCRGML
jgi:hypothetical protein